MKNLSKLPVGTKLVWDTMQQLYNEPPRRIYYPCLVVEQAKQSGWPPTLGACIRTAGNSQWMGDEQEHLRKPTEEELNTLDWNFKER